MCGPCEGYLFPGIFMHQLLPNRRRFGFGRTSFIALAEDIEIAGKKDDDAGDGSKNVSHCVLLSGTHTIRLFSLAITGRHVQPSEISYTASSSHYHKIPLRKFRIRKRLLFRLRLMRPLIMWRLGRVLAYRARPFRMVIGYHPFAYGSRFARRLLRGLDKLIVEAKR